MYIVTVEFWAVEDNARDFRAAIVANAQTSREREPGCRQFDVCIDGEDPSKIFLYEAYDDRAAFDDHLASPHFKAFDALVASWVRGKTVRVYERIDPTA